MTSDISGSIQKHAEISTSIQSAAGTDWAFGKSLVNSIDARVNRYKKALHYRQVLPDQKDITTESTKQNFEDALSDGRPIFLLLHGVGSNRAYKDRVARLDILSAMQYHTFAIDYRGAF